MIRCSILQRGDSRGVAGVLLLVAGSLLAGSLRAAEPPEPSYERRWMTSQSSPFFDLRNEVEEPESPDTPARPDTPGKPSSGSPGAGSEEAAQPSPEDASGTRAERPVDTGVAEPAASESDRSAAASDVGTTAPPTREDPGPLQPVGPEPFVPGTLSPLEMDSGPVPLPRGRGFRADTATTPVLAAGGSTDGSAPGNVLRNWGGWITLGLIVLGGWLGLVAYRSRRVRVLHSTPGGVPLGNAPADRRAPARSSSADGGTTDPVESARGEPGRGPSLWDLEDGLLEERGIDPRYRPVLRMYYQDQRSEQTIADTTEFNPGEIGLVLDMADRIEEERNHGAGA